MPNFIDRRLNPKDKSLGNRQRFLKRARAQIKEVVNQSLKERSITDVDGGQTISIPTKGIGEPRFHHARSGGRRKQVFTGNKEFVAGDRIEKPKGGAGEAAASRPPTAATARTSSSSPCRARNSSISSSKTWSCPIWSRPA
jgi:uncharacterized sporulation protein YeaH/YhbH (DUF444 family)